MKEKIIEHVELRLQDNNDKIGLHVILTIKQKNFFFKDYPIIYIENANTDNRKISITFYSYEDQFFNEIFEEIILTYLRKKEKKIKKEKLRINAFHREEYKNNFNYYMTKYFFEIKI